MTPRSQSPLGALIQRGLEAVGPRGPGPFDPQKSSSLSEAVESFAGGLLAATGYREIADDLSLEAVALLGSATVAGLKVIQAAEPGLYKLEDALYAFEDLLRRTAPVRV